MLVRQYHVYCACRSTIWYVWYTAVYQVLVPTLYIYVVSRAGEQLTDEADPCLFAGVRRVVRARCVGCVLGVLGVGLLKLLLSRVAEIYKAANCVEMATRYVKIYLLNIRKRNNRRGNTSQLQNLV